MDSFTQKVRTFDAFPKVDSQHSVRSQRGGFSTLLTVFCGLLILWVEVGGYVGGYIERQFVVDEDVKSSLTINLDMLVAMPCEFLHTNVVDVTKDLYLAGEELNFEGFKFYVPEVFKLNDANNEHDFSKLDMAMQESMRAEFRLTGQRTNEGAPACHIFGSIPVNQVKGQFHITAKGFGYNDRLHVPIQALNFSHVIQEFSYGDFYPFVDNPLDATAKVTTENMQAYKYHSRVVPTKYEQMGLIIDMNQYSLTENHGVLELDPQGRPTGAPGIYFKYDFEPIKLVIRERRLSFLQFVLRLATILGGLLIVAGHLYRLYERLLSVVFGKKFVEKDTEKKEGGLLDKEYSKKE